MKFLEEPSYIKQSCFYNRITRHDALSISHKRSRFMIKCRPQSISAPGNVFHINTYFTVLNYMRPQKNMFTCLISKTRIEELQYVIFMQFEQIPLRRERDIVWYLRIIFHLSFKINVGTSLTALLFTLGFRNGCFVTVFIAFRPDLTNEEYEKLFQSING